MNKQPLTLEQRKAHEIALRYTLPLKHDLVYVSEFGLVTVYEYSNDLYRLILFAELNNIEIFEIENNSDNSLVYRALYRFDYEQYKSHRWINPEKNEPRSWDTVDVYETGEFTIYVGAMWHPKGYGAQIERHRNGTTTKYDVCLAPTAREAIALAFAKTRPDDTERNDTGTG